MKKRLGCLLLWGVNSFAAAASLENPPIVNWHDTEIQNLAQLIDKGKLPDDYLKPDQVAIVIRRSAHAYLKIADTEMHGGFWPYRIHVYNTPAFQASFLIVLSGIPEAQRARLADYMRFLEGHKSDTCTSAVMEALSRGADIVPPTVSARPDVFLKAVLTNGFKYKNGSTVETKFITLEDGGVDATIKILENRRRRSRILYALRKPILRMSRAFKNQDTKHLQKHGFSYEDKFPVRNPKKKS